MKFLVIGGILLLIILLVKTRIKASMLFFSLLSLFYFIGLIRLEKLLVNFVNPAVVTLIILMVIMSIVEKTYLVEYLAGLLFKEKSLIGSTFRLSALASTVSGFLNNTAVVVSFLGPIKNNRFFSPSKFLIPLSYAAILGGVTTLIGTSTNLIVNSLAIDAGLNPLKMFDFIYVGVPVVILGVLYLTFFSNKMLPAHLPPQDKINTDYFLEARVLNGSSLIGKNLIKNGLRNLEKIFLAEIVRGERLISPVSPYEVIKENDTLVFTGEIGNIKDLERFDNLKIFGESDTILRGNLIEVVVSHTSELVGKSIKDVNFRGQFDAAVVAVKHGGRKVNGKIGIIELSAGDVLVLAPGSDFYKIEANIKNFYFINPLELNSRLSGPKAAAVVLLFLAVIAFNALGYVPLFQGLLAVLFLFLIFRFTTAKEIKSRIDLDLVLLIGSAIGISEVMMSTGVSEWIANAISHLFHNFGVYGGFMGVYFTTFILTQLVTNNAAAALAFPLAFSAALSFEASPMPFVMAVAYGASGSFLTPFGYQTNLLVYSAGNYTFTDYVKLGLPLSFIYSALVLILTPYFFPFY